MHSPKPLRHSRSARPTPAPAFGAAGRRRLSAEERAGLLARFADRRQSVATFCREVGISPATFHRWRREQPTGARQPARRFAAVQIAGAASAPTGTVSVLCPGGYTVLAPTGTDPHWLGQLAATLR